MTRIVGSTVSRHGRLRAFVTDSVGYANDGRGLRSLLEEIMNYHQLIKAIQENGAFSDRHHARKATEERDDVIAQLPADFADLLPASG